MEPPVQTALEAFFARFTSRRYGLGEMILRQDDTPQGIELIRSGHVRMYRVFEDGTELTINIYKKGSFFPMVWAICDLPNPYFFQTLTAVTTWRAPREDVVAFVKENPPVLFDLTKRLLSGYFGLLSHTETLLIGSAYQKVASVLVLLEKRFGKAIDVNKKVITLSFAHQDIAAFAHLSRETTSIQMKRLKDKKLISYHGRQIVIIDIEKLRGQLKSLE